MKRMRKKRAMTHEKASFVKVRGHSVESEFADLIGGFVIPGVRKKDVIDKHGGIHSVKGGDKKVQMFLYAKKRFGESIGFLGAKLFIDCIDSFPLKWEEYEKDRVRFKSRLQAKMRALRDFLSTKMDDNVFLHPNKVIFLLEAIFHSSEVDYLTIKHGDMFHIFDALQVIEIIHENTSLVNSKAGREGEMDDQKVVFKLKGTEATIGEIEVRHDSLVHYRQIVFSMMKEKLIGLLKEQIGGSRKISDKIYTYGDARKFKL